MSNQSTLSQRLQASKPLLGVFLIFVGGLALSMLAIEGASKGAIRQLPGADSFEHVDKVLHFLAHGFTSLLLFWGVALTIRIPEKSRRPLMMGLGVTLIDGLFGVGIEYVQQEFGSAAGRQFSIGDIVANLIGTITAVTISLMLISWELRENLDGKIHRDRPA
ncbi:hypothetical protein OAU50_00700 [Planctomycetota bacterium]|nr:hypothetical protein [Planctomycetota bacterium]